MGRFASKQYIYYSYNKDEQELNKWWDENYQRALNYVEKEKPSKVIKVFGGSGAKEFYNTSTTKAIAMELLNYLGPEEFEEILNEFEDEKGTILNSVKVKKEVKIEAKFKDKVKAIKKSLKKNDKRLSDETAEKSAEKIAGSMIKKESVNWNYYDKFKNITSKYLPREGEGDTYATQIVTAITKLIYKWYNDGDTYDTNYGYFGTNGNDLSSYANWLYKYVDGTQEILDTIQDCFNDSDYEKILKRLADNFLTEEYLEQANKAHKEGSIYECKGPFEFNEHWEDDEEDDYYGESKGLKTESEEQENKFNSIEFEKQIPNVMRWKEWDTVNNNDLYWVTQQFFNEEDVKQFAEKFKNTKFDKAFVTVRDLSKYQYPKDLQNKVLVIINKDGSYDITDYLETCKERGYDDVLWKTPEYENKKVKTEDIETNNAGGFYKDNKYYLGDPNAEYDEVVYDGEDEIDNLWTAVCCGDNKYLQNYYNNGGEPNKRYHKFNKEHSLIMGALRNNNYDTVKLLKANGETILEDEFAEYDDIIQNNKNRGISNMNSMIKKGENKKMKTESKVADMDDVAIIIELEGGELKIEDTDDWNAVKDIAKGFSTSQGFYSRLLRDMKEAEEEFGGVENLPFPIIM